MKKKTKIIAFRSLALLIIILIATFITYKVLTKPVSENTKEKKIEIPMDSSTKEIAKILKENNLIRNKLIFRIHVKIHKISNFQAGTYYLKENMDLAEITRVLQTGIIHDPNQITITYLEGKPMWWLAETIAQKTNNTEEDVYNLLENEEYINSLIEKYWFITEDIKNEYIYYPLEGYLFPDTYAISNKDVTVEEIFEKMLNQMELVLNDYREEIENSKYSVHEILTLASVVETEGMNEDARKNVASVFYNRLKLGMSLGSDVTTYYSIKVDMGDRNLYQAEIDSYNPYNTRGPNMEGKLPIGPISSISKTSVEAAVEPNETDYLFFVADKDGILYFTKTNSEHVQIINELKNSGMWYEY